MEGPGPKVTPFEYLFIPCDGRAAVKPIRFNGSSDLEVRQELQQYFRASGQLTDGQREDFKVNLSKQIQEQMKKQAIRKDDQDDAKNEMDPHLLSEAVGTGSDGQFEIVPVEMPSLENKFIATSLYIDDKGRFKELPLNDRASKIAQRDVRGDAFLLSNHDDPALDSWERVSTTIELYERLINKPPDPVNTNDQHQMAKQNRTRVNLSKLVSTDDAAEAIRQKVSGNAAFQCNDFVGAIQCYSKAIELTDARVDLLPNEVEVTEVRRASFLNRAQCFLNTSQFQQAEADALAALSFNANVPKAWYRLATAQLMMNDFQNARSSIASFENAGGTHDEVGVLRGQLSQKEHQFLAAEKKKYQGMFA